MIRALPLALAFASLATIAAAGPLTVAIDHSTRLSVAGTAASVVIGNPQVADVTVVDSHTVFVSGRGYGETDLVVLDPSGRTLYAGEVLVSGSASGRVSIYRGSDRTDMACAPGCEVTFRSPTKSGGGSGAGGGSTGTAAGAPAVASMLGAMAGAMAGSSAARTTAAPAP